MILYRLIPAAALTAVLALSAPADAEGAIFITPTWGQLSSGAGWRLHPIAGRYRIHWSIDIASRAGTPVLASAAGRIRYAGSYGPYGTTVVIDHGGGWVTLYGHLARAIVRPGQLVPQGAVIGTVGSTGSSTGPHLHFEIRFRGIPVNPPAYLGE